jgi:hypothetical protein
MHFEGHQWYAGLQGKHDSIFETPVLNRHRPGANTKRKHQNESHPPLSPTLDHYKIKANQQIKRKQKHTAKSKQKEPPSPNPETVNPFLSSPSQ